MVGPDDWGVTADEAAALLARQICPICGKGPWVSPLNHVARKHGIDRLTMRDICGLSMRDKVTDQSIRKIFVERGRRSRSIDTLRENSARTKGTRGRKTRRTLAFDRYMESTGLTRWIADHPDEVAEMRAGFGDRMKTPEAKANWAAAMERVRAEREPMRPSERRAFAALMARPDIVEKRRKTIEAAATVGCSVEDCDRPHAAKGLCSMHWKRARTH